MFESMHWYDAVSLITGILGLIFAYWTYSKEQRVRQLLEEKQEELNKTLRRLKELSEYADGITSYGVKI